MTAPQSFDGEGPDLRDLLRRAVAAHGEDLAALDPTTAFDLGMEFGALGALLLGRWASKRGPLELVVRAANSDRAYALAWAMGAVAVVRDPVKNSDRVHFVVAF